MLRIFIIAFAHTSATARWNWMLITKALNKILENINLRGWVIKKGEENLFFHHYHLKKKKLIVKILFNSFQWTFAVSSSFLLHYKRLECNNKIHSRHDADYNYWEILNCCCWVFIFSLENNLEQSYEQKFLATRFRLTPSAAIFQKSSKINLQKNAKAKYNEEWLPVELGFWRKFFSKNFDLMLKYFSANAQPFFSDSTANISVEFFIQVLSRVIQCMWIRLT